MVWTKLKGLGIVLGILIIGDSTAKAGIAEIGDLDRMFPDWQSYMPVTDASPPPTWYVRGIASALSDPTSGVLSAIASLPNSYAALARIDSIVPEQLAAVLPSLLKQAEGDDTDVQNVAVWLLGRIDSSSQKQHRTVVETLLKLATDYNNDAQEAALGALASLTIKEQEQRSEVVSSLIRFFEKASPENSKNSITFRNRKTKYVNDFPDDKKDLIALKGTVISVLGILGASYADQRELILKFLLNQALDTTIPEVRKNIAESLSIFGMTDSPTHDQQSDIIEFILTVIGSKKEYGPDVLLDKTISFLGIIEATTPRQQHDIVETLLGLASSDHSSAQSATEALDRISKRHPLEGAAIVDALVMRMSADDDADNAAAARAIGHISVDDPKQRRRVIEALVQLAIRGDRRLSRGSGIPILYTGMEFVATRSLSHISAADPADHLIAVEALLNLVVDPDRQRRSRGVRILAQIGVIGPAPDPLTVNALLNLKADDDAETATAAARVIAQIDGMDSEQRKAACEFLRDLAAGSNSDTPTSAIEALPTDCVNDPSQRKATVATLSRLSDQPDLDVQLSSIAALGQIGRHSPDQRQTTVDALLKISNIKSRGVQRGIVEALSQIGSNETEGRSAIVQALLKLIAHKGSYVRAAVAEALGQVAFAQSEERKEIINALIKLVGSSDHDVSVAAMGALLNYGPLRADEAIGILGNLHADGLDRDGFWRTIAWVFLGNSSGDDPGTILMTFAGRPIDTMIPWTNIDNNPPRAAQVLRVFIEHWPAISASKGLRDEVAERSAEITRHACPEAVGGLSESSIAALAGRVGQEWQRTRASIAAWLDGKDRTTCWHGKDRETLSQLRGDFASANLSVYAHDIDAVLAVDGSKPVIGTALLGTLGWALLWASFLAAFPYSARVRAVYLFNERLRGLLSLWFVPLIMTLAPFLRKRMLLPFREDLLADARLSTLDEQQWFGRSQVKDSQNILRNIGQAIPDIKDTVVLIGESGLGKSSFLRILAKKSRRTVVFLNARSCEKGIEEAIMQRVSGFQSIDFFRGLIYARDLAVIIDGLNEVTAEVRAIIIAFANRTGGADLLIATQPIEGIGTDRSPFTRSTIYEMLPLPRVDIEAFLKSRPARNNAESKIRLSDYDRAVDVLLANAMDNPPTDYDLAAAELILSNPMDLTYASELIALGQLPQPSRMIEQGFQLACKHYHQENGMLFPIIAFARKVIETRKQDRNWLTPDDFVNEQSTLLIFKLLVLRPRRETAEKQITVLRFRHDKVMDVLMMPAFDADLELQIELIEDPRFRGVYLLYAESADEGVARRLRDLVVDRAAETRDHTLSDEFVRRFNLRRPTASEGTQSAPFLVTHGIK